MTQLIFHLLGDYCLQSDWMAKRKTECSKAAAVHAFVYSLLFLFIADWKAWAVILVTHFFIDRYRLARFVCYAKNFLSPEYSGRCGMDVLLTPDVVKRDMLGIDIAPGNIVVFGQGCTISGAHQIREVCDYEGGMPHVYLTPVQKWWHRWEDCSSTGYHKDVPPWLSVWLMIIADNTLHLAINAFAIAHL